MEMRKWMKRFAARVRALFGSRVMFLGLQGSRARGEATPESDIDVVVILDRLNAEDLQAYNDMLAELPERERICGFVAGKRAVENWEGSDLLTLCLDSIPVYGSLDFARARLTDADARRSVQLGAGNLYHGAIHSFLGGRSMKAMAELYKSAGFVLRMAHYARTGDFVRRSDVLAERLEGLEGQVMRDAVALKKGVCEGDYDGLSDRLIAVAFSLLQEFGGTAK